MTTLQTLSLLVHARSKVGKSSLAATSPPPVCIFDDEGSTKFLPIRMIPWDPISQAPPVYDGTWDAAVVVVRKIEDIEKGFAWLVSGQHHFRSIVVDSLTEVQRKLKESLVGNSSMEWSNWDDLLRHLDNLTRGLRDLTQHPTNPILTATFITETHQKDGRYVPKLQGGIATSVPYWFDLVGYLYVEPRLDVNGIPMADPTTGKRLKKRQMIIEADHPLFEAGERVQGRLPDTIDIRDQNHPEFGGLDISSMLVTVFPQLAAQEA